MEANNIPFTLVILPYLQPYEKWQPYEVENRTSIIDILKKLKIRHFDLFDVMNEAIENGMNVQESEGDSWHPSKEVSTLFAKHLYEKHIF